MRVLDVHDREYWGPASSGAPHVAPPRDVLLRRPPPVAFRLVEVGAGA